MENYVEKLQRLYDIYNDISYEPPYLEYCITQGRPLIIYGAGLEGKQCKEWLSEKYGLVPVAFIDRDPLKQDTYIDGIPVANADEVKANHGNGIVGVAVYQYHVSNTVKDQIDLYLHQSGFPLIFDMKYCKKRFGDYIDQQSSIEIIAQLGDEISRENYYTFILKHMLGEQWTKQGAAFFSLSEQYMPKDLFALGVNDHVLDCGAYDGDSVQRFISTWPDIEHITAFEPGKAYHALNKTITGFNNRSCAAIQKAVCNQDGYIGFSDSSTSSRIADRGNNQIPACKIDSCQFSVPPTMIKMDIEGAELDALEGARQTITVNHPILAVCIYHDPSHLTEIPKWILSLYNDYKLFVRHYDRGHYEFVLYAVPPHRFLGKQ